MTLSDLISVFEGYATQEDLIFHFEAREQMPSLSNEEEISTDAVMQVVISSLNPSFDTAQVNIDFYFLKRLERDRTNYASVISDTFLLCADFQQYMEVNIAPTQGVNISFTNSALPVNNFDLDYTAGVTLSASIVYANDGQCVVPPPPACNPVTYEITDTDENILYSGSIVSGGELNQAIQDSTVTNSDDSYTGSVLAEGSLTLPDITVTDSNGSTYTQPSVTDVFCTPCEGVDVYVGEANVGTFPSGSDVFVKVIQDGLEVIPEDITVVDDEVSIILADVPPCPDTNIEVNGVSEGSVPSGSTIDVQLSDSGGTVTPDSVTLVGTDLQIVLPDAVAPTDPDVTAFLTAAGITDATIENAIEGLVSNLKSQGLWIKMKAIYPFVGGLASTHKFNLKNPLDTDAAFRIVFSGGWTHSATGAKPNGTNAYGDTKFNIASNLTTTSGSFGVYSRTNISEAGYDISHNGGGSNLWSVISRWVDNTFYAMYGHTFVNVSNTDSRGLFTVNRLGATNTEGYKNGLRVINTAIATASLQNANIALSAPSTSPSTQFSSKELAFAYISDGLTQAEQNALYNLVQLFQITLSRNV